MASVDDEYWARLCAHQPEAILVFTYSTLLIRASEHECWWVSGWFERILKACTDTMSIEAQTAINWAHHERYIREGADELAKTIISKH